jgi:hypothetical protein
MLQAFELVAAAGPVLEENLSTGGTDSVERHLMRERGHKPNRCSGTCRRAADKSTDCSRLDEEIRATGRLIAHSTRYLIDARGGGESAAVWNRAAGADVADRTAVVGSGCADSARSIGSGG